jgi:dolichol-phosphate mannosyltransferase
VKALVVIPTYDEAGSIEQVVDRVLRADERVELLVVDDASPDGTGDIVAARASSEDRLHLLRRPSKQGLGGAYRAGFAWGLARRYDALVEMDADLSHPADRLPALLDALDATDLAIGSRYVRGGRTVNWPWVRQLVSRAGNLYVQLALGLPVKDATAGFRAYRRGLLETLPVATVQSDGYCFQIEMAYRAWQNGFAVVEFPITFTERSTGVSKMSTRIAAEALLRVTAWSIADRRRRAGSRHPVSVAANHHGLPDRVTAATRRGSGFGSP